MCYKRTCVLVLRRGLRGTDTLSAIINRIFGWTSLSAAAYYMIAAGIIAGLIAAVFGFIDWTAIPNGTRAKRVGLTHGASMFVAVVLFIIAWFLHDHSNPSALALVLQIAGSGIAVGGGSLAGALREPLGTRA